MEQKLLERGEVNGVLCSTPLDQTCGGEPFHRRMRRAWTDPELTPECSKRRTGSRREAEGYGNINWLENDRHIDHIFCIRLYRI